MMSVKLIIVFFSFVFFGCQKDKFDDSNEVKHSDNRGVFESNSVEIHLSEPQKKIMKDYMEGIISLEQAEVRMKKLHYPSDFKKRYTPEVFNADVIYNNNIANIVVSYNYFNSPVKFRYRKKMTLTPLWNEIRNPSKSFKLKNLTNGEYEVELIEDKYSWSNAYRKHSKTLKVVLTDNDFDVKAINIEHDFIEVEYISDMELLNEYKKDNKIIYNLKLSPKSIGDTNYKNTDVSNVKGDYVVEFLPSFSDVVNRDRIKSSGGIRDLKIDTYHKLRYPYFHPFNYIVKTMKVSYNNDYNKKVDIRIKITNGYRKFYGVGNNFSLEMSRDKFKYIEFSYEGEWWDWDSYNAYQIPKRFGKNALSNKKIKNVEVSRYLYLSFDNETSKRVDIRYRKKGGSWINKYGILSPYKFVDLESDSKYEFQLSYKGEWWSWGGYNMYKFETKDNSISSGASDDIVVYNVNNNEDYAFIKFEKATTPLGNLFTQGIYIGTSYKDLKSLGDFENKKTFYDFVNNYRNGIQFIEKYKDPTYAVMYITKSVGDLIKSNVIKLKIPACKKVSITSKLKWKLKLFTVEASLTGKCI